MDEKRGEKYKVSVIVPVYNGEKFVLNCCNNLIAQTLKEIEIILIDDGSTDNSLKLIRSCAEQYSNVVMLHQENKGVSAARNYGIANASGEYLGFVDVDDTIEQDMYESLYAVAVEHNLDVLGMENIGKAKEITVFESNSDSLALLFTQKIRMSACNKIFKNGKGLMSFPVGIRINEDLMAVYDSLCCARKVGTINISKYNYVRHEGSGSRSLMFNEKYFDAIQVANEIYEKTKLLFPELKIENEARKARTYMRITKLYYMRGMPAEYSERIAELKEYLVTLDKSKLNKYFGKYDVIRYIMYLYFKPLFIWFTKNLDR